MSRKDYNRLADALRLALHQTRGTLGSHGTLKVAAELIAGELAEDNPRFDRTRFMRAAGFDESGEPEPTPHPDPSGRFVVMDRNRPGYVLAGPYSTRADAEAEQSMWAGTTDPYVLDRGTPAPQSVAADAEWQAVLADAESEGREHGVAAGGWLIDGNTTEETARRLLQGIEGGDPEILDMLPASPLSGEWAGGLTPRDVLAMYDLDEATDGADDVLAAFENGYAQGVADEVCRSARAILGDDEAAS